MIFSAAAGLAGQVVGGLMANKAQRRLKRQMQEQQRAQTNSFLRRYNENGLQRASAQAVLNRTMDAIKARNEQVAGQQAVMGGTEAGAAATKEANAQAMAQTASNILAQDDARKDALQAQQDRATQQYNTQMNQMEAQRVQNMAQAVSNGMQDLGGFVDSTKFGKNVNKKLGLG